MPLTVDIPADVLLRLEAEATRRGVALDALVTQLVGDLAAILPADPAPTRSVPGRATEFYGFVPFPKRGPRVTNEIIDLLRLRSPRGEGRAGPGGPKPRSVRHLIGADVGVSDRAGGPRDRLASSSATSR